MRKTGELANEVLVKVDAGETVDRDTLHDAVLDSQEALQEIYEANETLETERDEHADAVSELEYQVEDLRDRLSELEEVESQRDTANEELDTLVDAVLAWYAAPRGSESESECLRTMVSVARRNKEGAV